MFNDSDTPIIPGLYVAYINGLYQRYADRKLLMWHKEWFYPHSDQKYRDTVYGFVGPLPVLELED